MSHAQIAQYVNIVNILNENLVAFEINNYSFSITQVSQQSITLRSGTRHYSNLKNIIGERKLIYNDLKTLKT